EAGDVRDDMGGRRHRARSWSLLPHHASPGVDRVDLRRPAVHTGGRAAAERDRRHADAARSVVGCDEAVRLCRDPLARRNMDGAQVGEGEPHAGNTYGVLMPEGNKTSEVMAARAIVPQHVVSRAFEEETLLLNLESGQYHGINATGGRLLELIQDE